MYITDTDIGNKRNKQNKKKQNYLYKTIICDVGLLVM